MANAVDYRSRQGRREMSLFKGHNRKRILIADDDAAGRTLYEAFIAESLPDIGVDLAANGAEALELFGSGRHGLILMDLHMPVMSGLAAYRQICELCEKKKWPLPFTVFCTAYASPKAFADIIQSGNPHSFLGKPITSEQLLDVVRGYLKTAK
jgi:CheY-like chemotaxis protein